MINQDNHIYGRILSNGTTRATLEPCLNMVMCFSDATRILTTAEHENPYSYTKVDLIQY